MGFLWPMPMPIFYRMRTADGRYMMPIFFFCQYVCAGFIFFLHLIKYNSLIITNNTQNFLT